MLRTTANDEHQRHWRSKQPHTSNYVSDAVPVHWLPAQELSVGCERAVKGCGYCGAMRFEGMRPEVYLGNPHSRGQGFAAVNPGFTNV